MPVVLMLLMDPFEHDPRVEKEATSLTQAGHPVTVLAWNRFGTSKDIEERNGVRIERVRVLSPRGSRWRAVYRLLGVLGWMLWRSLRTPHDVLVCHEMHTWPVGWLLKLLRPRHRVIFDAHEPYAEQIVGVLPHASRLRRPLLWAEGLLARSADVVVTVSPLMLERYRRMGVRRLEYLPNVPRLQAPPGAPPRPAVRAAPFVIGRLGVIAPRYSGVEPLVNIVARVNELGVDVKLVLGGPITNGWEAGFQALLACNQSYVQYVGIVPIDEVMSYVASFDLVASLFEPLQPKAPYGYSTKIFEAMAAGVAVLTTRGAEDQFLVADAGCGLVVDYPFNIDAVAREVAALLPDESRRRAYGARGQAAVRERFNWAQYEGAFLNLFRS